MSFFCGNFSYHQKWTSSNQDSPTFRTLFIKFPVYIFSSRFSNFSAISVISTFRATISVEITHESVGLEALYFKIKTMHHWDMTKCVAFEKRWFLNTDGRFTVSGLNFLGNDTTVGVVANRACVKLKCIHKSESQNLVQTSFCFAYNLYVFLHNRKSGNCLLLSGKKLLR